MAGVAEVLRSGWLTSGPQVKAFEAKLSEYFGGPPVRAFNSGTCTMEIALRIAGVRAGDEVITTPAHLGRDEQRHPRGRGEAGLRGHRPGDDAPRPRQGRARDHAQRPERSSPSTLPACRSTATG